jgi:hypothetical protein
MIVEGSEGVVDVVVPAVTGIDVPNKTTEIIKDEYVPNMAVYLLYVFLSKVFMIYQHRHAP